MIYSLILTCFSLLACLLFVTLIIVTQRSSRGPGNHVAVALFAVLALYTFGYALELQCFPITVTLQIISIEHIGISLAPVFVLLLIFRFWGVSSHTIKQFLPFLCVIPIITLLIVWTDLIIPWMYQDAWMNSSSILPGFEMVPGVWWYVKTIWNVILLSVSLIVLGLMFFSKGTAYRKQIFLMFIGVLAPFFALFLNNILHNIIPIDVTPYTLVVTGLTIFPAITRYNLLNIIPVAHATVFKTLGSGLIVLDRLGKVREMNPASEEIFQVNGSEIIGQEARYSLPQGIFLSDLAQSSIPIRGELEISDSLHSEFYLVDVMPLTEGGTEKTGSVLMITRITDQKKKEEQLVEYSGIIGKRNDELNSAYEKIQAAYEELEKNQDALKESEQSLQKAQKIAHLGSYEWSTGDTQVYASDEFKRIFGIPVLNPPPALENLIQWIAPTDRDRYTRSIEALIISGVPFAIDFWISREDGSRRAVRGQGEIDCDDKEVTQFTLIVQDITDQKLMEEEINEASLEKVTLLREIHHRVKNNMQIISSLLSMQARTITDPVIQSLFKETQTRVRSLALVHEHLYQSNKLNRINYKAYLQKITGYLLQSYEILPGAIICTLEVQNIELSIEKAVPCSLIITELLTNSFKYAFIDGRKGEIQIGLSLNPSTGEYVLDYRDNGQGFPIGVDPIKDPGFGSTLIMGLTGQLSGTMRVEPEEHGVHYRIIFPS